MADCIHEHKMRELQVESSDEAAGVNSSSKPYVLCGVAHSLGGAAIMIHVVMRRLRRQPHRFHRLILLSPAGFHEKTPVLFSIMAAILPWAEPFLRPIFPGVFIPTRALRLLFNKLTQDFQNIPALRALVQVIISSLLVGGDSSDWVGALRQPHYNANDMPGLAFPVMKHLAQMKRAHRFLLYDYGSRQRNQRAYGQNTPLDIGAHYGLVDIPVDVVMGRRDRIIPAQMVKRHYLLLKEEGREATLREFEFAHLDFTFAQHQELLGYVMSRLHLAVKENSQ